MTDCLILRSTSDKRMRQRSYNQYCPIAHALDLVGDRWTLLIVRDLLLGPKRFSDLFGGLSGIGTNLLTDRLKQLEQAGIVQRRTLPPPAASAVYELTTYGRELEEVLRALAHWGGQSLGRPEPAQVLSRDSVLLATRELVRHYAANLPASSYLVQIRDERFHEPLLFRVVENDLTIGFEPADDAFVTLQLDLPTLFALSAGTLSPAEACARGLLAIGGTPLGDS